MDKCRLLLLGPVRLEGRDGSRIGPLGAKTKALLAFLAAQADGCAGRETLAGLLWDTSAETEARQSLRQVLSKLRSRLGCEADHVLRADHEEIELRLDRLDIDLRQFEASVEAPNETALPAACRLWRGPFCEGLNSGSERFEEWLLLRRMRLDEVAAASFKRVAEIRLTAGCFGSAVSAAHHCVDLDPFGEGSHAALIDVYRRLGWIGQARAAHRRCVALFQSELGVMPGGLVEEAAASLGR